MHPSFSLVAGGVVLVALLLPGCGELGSPPPPSDALETVSSAQLMARITGEGNRDAHECCLTLGEGNWELRDSKLSFPGSLTVRGNLSIVNSRLRTVQLWVIATGNLDLESSALEVGSMTVKDDASWSMDRSIIQGEPPEPRALYLAAEYTSAGLTATNSIIRTGATDSGMTARLAATPVNLTLEGDGPKLIIGSPDIDIAGLTLDLQRLVLRFDASQQAQGPDPVYYAVRGLTGNLDVLRLESPSGNLVEVVTQSWNVRSSDGAPPRVEVSTWAHFQQEVGANVAVMTCEVDCDTDMGNILLAQALTGNACTFATDDDPYGGFSPSRAGLGHWANFTLPLERTASSVNMFVDVHVNGASSKFLHGGRILNGNTRIMIPVLESSCEAIGAAPIPVERYEYRLTTDTGYLSCGFFSPDATEIPMRVSRITDTEADQVVCDEMKALPSDVPGLV